MAPLPNPPPLDPQLILCNKWQKLLIIHDVKSYSLVGPGLAQLEERLAHRYSEGSNLRQQASVTTHHHDTPKQFVWNQDPSHNHRSTSCHPHTTPDWLTGRIFHMLRPGSQPTYIFLKKVRLADTCPVLAATGTLVLDFRGDVSSGFQSQSGLP